METARNAPVIFAQLATAVFAEIEKVALPNDAIPNAEIRFKDALTTGRALAEEVGKARLVP